MQEWQVRSGRLSKVAVARTAREAFDVLKGEPAEAFGLIATADAGRGEDECIPIRTARLFADWGDRVTARRFIARAIEEGLGDTTGADLGGDA